MILTFDQKTEIIKLNPNKELVKYARETADELMLLIYGKGMDSAIRHDAYFENTDVFTVRKNGAISNRDLFARLFEKEQMIFSAQGGSSYYTGLDKVQTEKMNATIDSIRFSMTLRNWIKQFAKPAFKCDPMGIIFVEHDKDQNPYPTYKSSLSIYDYKTTGRKVEYVIFQLNAKDAKAFGVVDDKLKEQKNDFKTNYYRVIDDEYDVIIKWENNLATELTGLKIKNPWKEVPGFVISDIISFEDTSRFLSPVYFVQELAKCFLHDRSIRDLQKKYHGFLKAIEPLLRCGICEGTGFLSGSSCPECTPAGSDKGTGFKLRTKVADVARFPIDNMKEANFDFKKIFGYVELPIDVWDKQDSSLQDNENLINDVYWGTDSRNKTTGPTNNSKSIEETATKTLANLQPIYSRLNMVADWAEKTENMIADFVGKYLFPGTFKKSSINYGRYYILETPYELMEEYLNMKKNRASQSALFAALNRYTHSMYESDPVMLAVELKMIKIEPFVHSTILEVQQSSPVYEDYIAKLYFSEWKEQQDFDFLLSKKEVDLRTSLYEYAKLKAIAKPEPQEQTAIKNQ